VSGPLTHTVRRRLGSALWVLHTTSCEDATHAAIDRGGDTDPAIAVTGREALCRDQTADRSASCARRG